MLSLRFSWHSIHNMSVHVCCVTLGCASKDQRPLTFRALLAISIVPSSACALTRRCGPHVLRLSYPHRSLCRSPYKQHQSTQFSQQ